MIYLSNAGVVVKDKNKLALLLVAITFAVVGSLGLLMPALAHNNHYQHNTKVITPLDLAQPPNTTTTQKSWYFYDDNLNAPSTAESPGDYEFTTEVGGSHGTSAVKFAPEAGERWNIATNQLAGRKLSHIDELAFNQYTPAVSTGGTSTTLFLNIDVDFDNTAPNGYKGRLIYLPQDNGTVVPNTWQEWDAIDNGNAVWQWSRFVSNGNQWPNGNTDPTLTWSQIKAAFPNAAVFNESFTGQTLIRGGHPGPAGLVGYVDGVTLNHTTYDFEVVVGPPTTKDQCKNGGWMTFNNPSFRSQGRCIDYVERHANKIKGDVEFTAYGLDRRAEFSMNTTGDGGRFKYSDSNNDWYKVDVSSVKVSGSNGWFAGKVTEASNPTWVGLWLFAKVEDNAPDKIWGSFTDQATAEAGVASMTNPADGPFNVTQGNLRVH